MENKKINVGFIGCGRVAENHFQAIQKCHSANLVAVSDINEQYGKTRAKQWGVPFNPTSKLLANKDIDVIFVLSPLETHFELAKECMENGKHVLVEKPVSLNSEEIRELDRLSKKFNRICFPGHSYLYAPELKRMREKIPSGEIGTPTSMFMNEIYLMPDDLVQKYHGPTIEVLYHHIYLLLAFMGKPTKLHAFSGCFREQKINTGDEQVMVHFQYDNGALAQLFISWAGEDETSDPWTFKVKVLGNQGGMHFSRRDYVSLKGNNRDFPIYDEMFEQEVDYFLNMTLLNGIEPLSTLEDAAITTDILNAVRFSVKNGTVENL